MTYYDHESYYIIFYIHTYIYLGLATIVHPRSGKRTPPALQEFQHGKILDLVCSNTTLQVFDSFCMARLLS